jgi:hypothetical protein
VARERAVLIVSTAIRERAEFRAGTECDERAGSKREPLPQRAPLLVSEPERGEGTLGREQAVPSESIDMSERAARHESTVTPERAAGHESTVRTERAGVRESTVFRERAVPAESTVTNKRAVAQVSTVIRARAAMPEVYP